MSVFKVFHFKGEIMISSKVKVFSVVLLLLLFVSFTSSGCGREKKNAWVNTNSMPGRTFKSDAKNNNSRIISLGSSSESSGGNFGPGEVNFEFRNLR